ncbi:MAG: hypothetical protein ABJE95_04550 [Byssovorax sp.]
MRATLFLSSLFAVSLIGGVALAERPSDGAESRRPVRDHKISELRPHEASTVREHVAPVSHEKSSVREPRVLKEAPNRGDNIDRSYAAHAVMGADKAHQQNAAPGAKTINKAYLEARNCSDTDTDCAKVHGGKPAGNASDHVEKKDDAAAQKHTRAQIKEMVDKLHQMMCQQHAASCADYL